MFKVILQLPRPNFPVSSFLLFSEHISGKPAPCGTGFPVVSPCGVLLILTAGHCLQGNLSPMYLSGDSFVSLADHKAIVNNELDIAALVIHDPLILSSLGPVLEVLPTATMDTLNEESFFQVTGFPQSKNKFKKGKRFNRHGVVLSLDEVNGDKTKLSKKFLPEDVIYHTLSPKQLVDDNGKKTNFLSRFEGLSGGPVVKYTTTNQGMVAQLAGIFTRWERRTGTAMSVRWEAVLDWMEYVTPEILHREGGLTALTPRL